MGVVWPEESLPLLKGSGLGWVRVWGEGWGVVRVSEDDTDCALRGRPFCFAFDLNLCRLALGESACY